VKVEKGTDKQGEGNGTKVKEAAIT
jgi:hypothetical protein